LAESEGQRITVQGELDDLLMVFGDVEEKAARYRVRWSIILANIS